MTKRNEKLWTERYRPKSLNDYVFQDKILKNKIFEYIEDGEIPHLLLTGVQGTGKTSIAKLLVELLKIDEEDLMKIDGSVTTSVEKIRTDVSDFSMTFPVGKYKVVYIEEADRLSAHAQDSLKTMMEERSDLMRFILVCNRENMILPYIKSRIQHFRFKTHKKTKVLEMMCGMLDTENVDYEPELVLEYVDVCYPDIRKTINTIQQNTIGDVLQPLKDLATENSDYKLNLLTAIEAGNWFEAITTVVPNVTPEAWEEMYQFVYENYTKAPFTEMAQMKQAIITVAEYLYRHALVADPAINAAAMFAALSEI